MRSRFHRDPDPRQVGEPLVYSCGCRSESSSVDYFSTLVERAVMAPDISKVDPDRHLDLGAAEWNFRDKVMRQLFHGNSLSDPKDPLIPFFGKYDFLLGRSCSKRRFREFLDYSSSSG
jgi:hypothetical protein